MLMNKLKQDLKIALLRKNEAMKNAIRMIFGEIDRLDKRGATDEEIGGIVKKLIKSELIVLEYSNKDPEESIYIKTLEQYLPQMMSEAKIREWILTNINTLPDQKIQVMGEIMKSLKGKADGAKVRKVLMEI